MHKSTVYLISVLCLASLASSALVCPLDYFDDTTAGFCKDCTLLDSTVCGTTADCPWVYMKIINASNSVCSSFPICEAGSYFNKAGITAAEQVCKPCSSAPVDICSSSLCSGYFFDTSVTPNVCQPNPDCPDDKYFLTESCLNCNGAAIDATTQLICGIKGGCTRYFVNATDPAGSICSPCSAVQNSDPTILTIDNTYCYCMVGYWWNPTTASCDDCAVATTVEICKQCEDFIFNVTAPLCIACSVIPSSNGTYDKVHGGCSCQAGFTWDSAKIACIPCSEANIKGQCGLETCFGYFFEAMGLDGAKCLLCNTVDNTNSSVNDAAYGNDKCTCVLDSAWVASATAGVTGKCGTCADITVAADCNAAACPNYLWDGAACTDLCTAASAGAGAIDGTVSNGQCACNPATFWDTTTRKCVECAATTNQTICQSESCLGYLWRKTTCDTCDRITNVDLAVTPTTTVNGVCACLTKFRWNSVNSSCDSCTTAPIIECGKTNCEDYFINVTTCKLCPTATTNLRNASTPYTACNCRDGYIWSNLTNSCITCNSTTSALNIKTNACVLCNSTLTNNYNGTNDTYSCKCKTGYLWSNGICGCNTTKLEFDKGNGAGCATCNLFPGGTTFNATTKVCNCIPGATWSTSLKKCQCTAAGTYIVGTLCTLCSTLGKGVTTGGSALNPDQCTCASGWKWDLTLKTCVCSEANSIFNKNATAVVCESCTLLKFSSNGTRSSTNPAACACRSGMIWDLKTLSCICDTVSIPTSNKAVCISCASLFGSTGNKTGSSACVCKTGWVWNSNLGNCVCLTTTCACLSGFVLNASKICTNCSTITGTTGFALSPTVCECVKSYVWNATTSTCDCPKGGFTNGAKSFCRFCDIYSNSNGKFATAANSSCACLNNYKWSTTTLQCEFTTAVPLPVNITLLNGTNISCKSLTNTSLVAQDSFSCKCPAGKFWNDYVPDCLPCSGVINSTGKLINPTSCECNAGSFWDILSLSCKLLTCKYPITDSRCTYCPKHPGNVVSAQLLIVTAYEKPALLSGDNLFATYAKQGSSQYLNYTSYKCLCATNYTWSIARRRCYNKTLNATA